MAPHPFLVVLSTEALLLTPWFCSRLFRCGHWVFGLFSSFVHNLPHLSMHTVVLVSFSLCILLLKERCVQVKALQQRVPGPSLAHMDTPAERPQWGPREAARAGDPPGPALQALRCLAHQQAGGASSPPSLQPLLRHPLHRRGKEWLTPDFPPPASCVGGGRFGTGQEAEGGRGSAHVRVAETTQWLHPDCLGGG